MVVGIYQFNPVFGDVVGNLNRIASELGQTDADVIVLPELCTTGYQFVSRDEVCALCEFIPDGKTVRFLESVCRKKGQYIVAGMGEKVGDICYNASVLIGPEGHLGTYRKVHLFYREKEWFAPGDLGFPVWDIGMVKIGMMICFDWIYPEAARSLALLGAELVAHPANLVLPYCQAAMITRSIENRIFTATANRIGTEARDMDDPLAFTGGSQITSPKGERLMQFTETEERLDVIEIDPADARNKKLMPTNDLLKDRKLSQYHL